MNTKQIAAVVVVVIVVIAAVAVVYMSGDDYEQPEAADVASGAIYGNVDGNGYIDDVDVETVQRIIDGEIDASEYPLADANLDNVVDEQDLAIVRAAANGESTTLYVVNVDGSPIAVQYPIDNYAMTSGTNMKSVIAVLGLADSMSAIAIDTETMSPVLDAALTEAIAEGSVATLTDDSQNLTTESLNILVNLGVTLVIGDDTGMSSDDSMIETMENLGITYLQLNTKNLYLQINTLTALGILLDCTEKAQDYIGWIDDVLDTIVENEGDQYGTKTVLTVTMSRSVSGTSSDYYEASIIAGGNNIADWENSTRSFAAGDTWLLDEKYNADFMFHFRTVTYPDGMTEESIATYSGYFADTYTYQNGGYNLINGSLPIIVRIAIMAETMYPDCFEEGWAESLFQEYVTSFLGIDFDVSETEYAWNV